jgi:predicted nucleic acid-binding protein
VILVDSSVWIDFFRGVTIRKTIDTLIATKCVESDIALLFSDRDFDPFVEYLGLRSALAEV